MDSLQLATFIKCHIRLLEKAFEESDGMMVGADRHEVFEHVGGYKTHHARLHPEEHRAENPLDWSEEPGTAKALDPIKKEIEAMKATVEILKGEK